MLVPGNVYTNEYGINTSMALVMLHNTYTAS